ncbi:MAG: hypothetical protein J6K58_14180 [Lachnospiraceae bacterium]|nr:hypothetical protein [Lachnospiraceae bacterium]
MTKHYEQRKKSNQKYLNKFEDIKIRVPEGKREVYKQYAASVGKSLNQLVIDLIEREINN